MHMCEHLCDLANCTLGEFDHRCVIPVLGSKKYQEKSKGATYPRIFTHRPSVPDEIGDVQQSASLVCFILRFPEDIGVGLWSCGRASRRDDFDLILVPF